MRGRRRGGRLAVLAEEIDVNGAGEGEVGGLRGGLAHLRRLVQLDRHPSRHPGGDDEDGGDGGDAGLQGGGAEGVTRRMPSATAGNISMPSSRKAERYFSILGQLLPLNHVSR